MPVYVDVKVNEELVSRVYIARMSKNGLNPNSVNEYSAVVGQKEPFFHNERMCMEFPAEPTWLQWETGTRLHHQYGSGVLELVQRALHALEPKVASARERDLQQQLDAAHAEIAALKAQLDAA